MSQQNSSPSADTGAIQFTQFLRPDGRQRWTSIVRPMPVVEQAQKLAAVGCRFEIEQLMTGQVSMSVERMWDDELETLGMEIVDNGPEVPLAVDRMIGEAFSAAFSANGDR